MTAAHGVAGRLVRRSMSEIAACLDYTVGKGEG